MPEPPEPTGHDAALEVALEQRAARARLDAEQAPSAWQQAALDDGVDRRPDTPR